jgi:hypothetical protein
MSNKIQFIQLEDGTQQISETGVITFSAGSILRVDTSTISNSLDVVNVEYLTNAALTDAQIKTKYENNANTNAFTDSEKSKLAGLDSSKFLGEYVSLGALQTAHSSPVAGSYANVDSGASSDVERYMWDSSDNAYVQQAGTSISALTNGQIYVGDASNAAQSVAMSGDTTISNTGVVTIGADKVTYDKMQDTTQAALLGNQTGAGTVSEIPIVEQYLSAGATATLLEATTNWDVNGNYTGTSITGTFQGQSHYNGNYWFTAVADNTWIRLIRG